LPVVGVAAGGVAESVDEEVGQLATVSEAAAFAEAIEALFARDVRTIGLAARRRAVARHGWDAVFTELCGVYGRLTRRRAFEGRAAPASH
jgi:alpha-1,6-mannosyltransferase